MLWKKLLLELGALGGFGGGIGGWINTSGGGIKAGSEEETVVFGTHRELKKEPKKAKKLSQKINLLNKTALGSWRWKSEGVGQEFLYVEGWDRAGPHKIINSTDHSQSSRDLYGGVKISKSMGWFGPRKVTYELEELEKVKDFHKNVSYWPQIQNSGKYINQKDLNGLQKFWSERSRELEEDIFGLYHGWDWWAKQFGKTSDGQRVELEFDFSKIKEMLNKSEQELRDNPWTYGEVFKNSKLNLVRLVGNVEDTAFNYLKHLAWPNQGKVKDLKEKKIVFAIIGLILGEEYGFDCQSGNEGHKNKFFKECLPIHEGKIQNGGTVKKVLKTTWGNSSWWGSTTYYVPEAQKGAHWHQQSQLDSGSQGSLLKMDDIKTTGLLFEKCEEESTMDLITDRTKKIRREVCDQIIRPWFGNIVSDKRLCLIEMDSYNYYLRLQTYLEVLQIPTWMNRNTFWTKCSNYSI